MNIVFCSSLTGRNEIMNADFVINEDGIVTKDRTGRYLGKEFRLYMLELIALSYTNNPAVRYFKCIETGTVEVKNATIPVSKENGVEIKISGVGPHHYHLKNMQAMNIKEGREFIKNFTEYLDILEKGWRT